MCENINSLPFSFLAQKIKGDSNAHKAETNGKATSRIFLMDFFLRLKNPHDGKYSRHTILQVYACGFAWTQLQAEIQDSSLKGVQATFNCRG